MKVAVSRDSLLDNPEVMKRSLPKNPKLVRVFAHQVNNSTWMAKVHGPSVAFVGFNLVSV